MSLSPYTGNLGMPYMHEYELVDRMDEGVNGTSSLPLISSVSDFRKKISIVPSP